MEARDSKTCRMKNVNVNVDVILVAGMSLRFNHQGQNGKSGQKVRKWKQGTNSKTL